MIVPTGIATDYSHRFFFRSLVDQRRLVQALMFDNQWRIFPSVHPDTPFVILVVGLEAERPVFCAYALAIEHALDPQRRFTLTPEQIARINPNTRTAPIFRSRADADLTATIYDRVPVLIEERSDEEGGDVNPWGIELQQGLFNMTSASGLFRTADQLNDAGWQRDGTDWVSDDEADRVVPLYEAKMIHHFDHRGATYSGTNTGDDEGARDVTLAEKADPDFEPNPRYWVPEAEVRLRSARVSAALKRAVREGDEKKALKALAEHVAAAWPETYGRPATGDDLIGALGRDQAWNKALGATPGRWLARPATQKTLEPLQRRAPLDKDDLRALADAPPGILDKALILIERKQPRWLMGWRDITNATNERTVVGGVFPHSGVGNNLPLWMPLEQNDSRYPAALAATLSSLSLDFVARQKVGGKHLNFFIAEQLPVLGPEVFSLSDLDFIAPRVLELTYTSHTMRRWAEGLGHTGSPFGWDPDRRMQIRAELDGFFARKYGLTRDELRYVLDPTDVHGADYPSETFRGLRDKEIGQFGEYLTQRLVLEAYDKLERVS